MVGEIQDLMNLCSTLQSLLFITSFKGKTSSGYLHILRKKEGNRLKSHIMETGRGETTWYTEEESDRFGRKGEHRSVERFIR